MSVNVRPYRKGGWEVDIMLVLANGQRIRRRFKAPVPSKSGARRWGEQREQHLILEARGMGPDVDEDEAPTPVSKRSRGTRGQPRVRTRKTKKNRSKEVPTLAEFSPRYLDGYARANREKPSSIAAKESILRVHLIPRFGKKRLDALEQEDVQRLKAALADKASEWDVIAGMPVRIRLLKVSQKQVEFYDFDEYEALVEGASKCDPRSLLVVLLGGEAGLRRGEIMALKWTDIDFRRRLLTVARSLWKGHETTPKGNRIRTVPMTTRLAETLTTHRHLRGPRVLCRDDGQPFTAKIIRDTLGRAQRRANMKDKGPHTLRHSFCSHLAMRGAPARAIQELAGHRHLTTTQRYMHLSPGSLQSAISLLEPGAADAAQPVSKKFLETGWRRDADVIKIK